MSARSFSHQVNLRVNELGKRFFLSFSFFLFHRVWSCISWYRCRREWPDASDRNKIEIAARVERPIFAIVLVVVTEIGRFLYASCTSGAGNWVKLRVLASWLETPAIPIDDQTRLLLLLLVVLFCWTAITVKPARANAAGPSHVISCLSSLRSPRKIDSNGFQIMDKICPSGLARERIGDRAERSMLRYELRYGASSARLKATLRHARSRGSFRHAIARSSDEWCINRLLR